MKKVTYNYYCDICGKEIPAGKRWGKHWLNNRLQRVLDMCEVEDVCPSCCTTLTDVNLMAVIKQLVAVAEK